MPLGTDRDGSPRISTDWLGWLLYLLALLLLQNAIGALLAITGTVYTRGLGLRGRWGWSLLWGFVCSGVCVCHCCAECKGVVLVAVLLVCKRPAMPGAPPGQVTHCAPTDAALCLLHCCCSLAPLTIQPRHRTFASTRRQYAWGLPACASRKRFLMLLVHTADLQHTATLQHQGHTHSFGSSKQRRKVRSRSSP